MSTEGVLIFGASGNIGVAAVIAALRSGRRAIAVVRSDKSAESLRTSVASGVSLEKQDQLKTLVADLSTVEGFKNVVARAIQADDEQGRGFQHVWASMGPDYHETPILELERDFMREMMIRNFEPNLLAYQSTMPHLLSLPAGVDATFTMCTGSQGDIAERAQPAMIQGALFSMASIACRDNESTNVRFNEAYLAFRVQVDALDNPYGIPDIMSSSDFAKTYEQILDGSGKARKSCRMLLEDHIDVDEVRFVKKPFTGKHPYVA
ncbi:SDR family NAD(P)-dependent oxidoreductase [Microdochium nivale]|nr:SDR family NAD(P)-dependent oxidoreductase [Microdochium nivale]